MKRAIEHRGLVGVLCECTRTICGANQSTGCKRWQRSQRQPLTQRRCIGAACCRLRSTRTGNNERRRRETRLWSAASCPASQRQEDFRRRIVSAALAKRTGMRIKSSSQPNRQVVWTDGRTTADRYGWQPIECDGLIMLCVV